MPQEEVSSRVARRRPFLRRKRRFCLAKQEETNRYTYVRSSCVMRRDLSCDTRSQLLRRHLCLCHTTKCLLVAQEELSCLHVPQHEMSSCGTKGNLVSRHSKKSPPVSPGEHNEEISSCVTGRDFFARDKKRVLLATHKEIPSCATRRPLFRHKTTFLRATQQDISSCGTGRHLSWHHKRTSFLQQKKTCLRVTQEASSCDARRSSV